MTNTDILRFGQAFNRLAVALRLPVGEVDAAMQQVYFDALCDFSIEAIEAAAERLTRTSQWFPKTSEWRIAASEARIQTLVKELPASREEPWHDECGACHDTGWEERICYRGTRNTCGRRSCEKEPEQDSLKEHRYMSVCTCRPTNRTYARHHKIPGGRLVH